MGGAMKFIFIMIFSVFFLSCSHQPKVSKETVQEAHKSFQIQLDQALNLMNVDQDNAALRILKNLFKKTKISQLKSVVLYNIGLLLEKKKKCSSAKIVYNKAISMNELQDSVIEAQALWRLSFVKECLKDYHGMLAVLKDVQSRTHLLPPETAFVELNSKMALAYKKLEKPKLYEDYWLKARKGLRVLNERISSINHKKASFSRLFYNLGNFGSGVLDDKASLSYLKRQRDLQKYFLRSVELTQKPWSYRSAKKIIEDYKNFVHLMKKTNSKIIAKEILKNIKSLKSQRFPDPKESPLVKKLFKIIDVQYKKVKNYIHDSEKNS